MTDRRRLVAREHRWLRLRLAGWSLVGTWQFLLLAAEFVPLDVTSRGMRIAGHLIGIVGLVIVAIGFERILETAHERTGAHPQNR